MPGAGAVHHIKDAVLEAGPMSAFARSGQLPCQSLPVAQETCLPTKVNVPNGRTKRWHINEWERERVLPCRRSSRVLGVGRQEQTAPLPAEVHHHLPAVHIGATKLHSMLGPPRLPRLDATQRLRQVALVLPVQWPLGSDPYGVEIEMCARTTPLPFIRPRAQGDIGVVNAAEPEHRGNTPSPAPNTRHGFDP